MNHAALSPKTIDEVIRIMLDSGCVAVHAAGSLGISATTFREWLRAGEASLQRGELDDYALLRLRVMFAEQRAEAEIAERLLEAATRDANARLHVRNVMKGNLANWQARVSTSKRRSFLAGPRGRAPGAGRG